MPPLRPLLLPVVLASGLFVETRGEEAGSPPDWTLAAPGVAPSLYVDSPQETAVVRAAGDFAQDLERVSGQPVRRTSNAQQLSGGAVIVGVLGHSP